MPHFYDISEGKPMKVNLNGQVAVVTGGAQGIGWAIVQALADNGARMAIVDVDAESGDRAAREISMAGGKCIFLPGDVSNVAQMEEVAGEVERRLGGVHILVNNAGINKGRDHRVPIHEYSLEDWHQIVEVDLTGVFLASRVFIPYMLKNHGGRIVNISSSAGLVPLRLQSAFVAAKAGVVNLTRSMALELGPHRKAGGDSGSGVVPRRSRSELCQRSHPGRGRRLDRRVCAGLVRRALTAKNAKGNEKCKM